MNLYFDYNKSRLFPSPRFCMAASFSFGEDGGTANTTNEAAGPPTGTVRTTGSAVNQVNWKNTDDVATAYSSSPIAAGNNSYQKFQFGVWTGSFNQISNGKWSHMSGVFGAGLTLKASGGSGYFTPTTTADGRLNKDYTITGDVATGDAILFSPLGPQKAGSSTLSSPGGFSQYLATQLQTNAATAQAGDSVVAVIACQYDEN